MSIVNKQKTSNIHIDLHLFFPKIGDFMYRACWILELYTCCNYLLYNEIQAKCRDVLAKRIFLLKKILRVPKKVSAFAGKSV